MQHICYFYYTQKVVIFNVNFLFRIALSLAALAVDDNGQAIFPAQLVAHVPYAVIAPFVGIVFVMVYEIHRAKNNVVMDMLYLASLNVAKKWIQRYRGWFISQYITITSAAV